MGLNTLAAFVSNGVDPSLKSESWKEEVEGSTLRGGGRSGLVADLCVCLLYCLSGMTEKQRSDRVYRDFDFFKLE